MNPPPVHLVLTDLEYALVVLTIFGLFILGCYELMTGYVDWHDNRFEARPSKPRDLDVISPWADLPGPITLTYPDGVEDIAAVAWGFQDDEPQQYTYDFQVYESLWEGHFRPLDDGHYDYESEPNARHPEESNA